MLTDAVSLSTIAVAVIALGALYFARGQFKMLADQLALANRTTIAEAYTGISVATAEFNKIFIDNPEWYPYFYSGEEPPDDPELGRKLEHVCESIMDFVDVVIELRNALPNSAMDWSTWDAWFRFIYQNSPAMKEWVLDNLEFFPDYEFSPLGLIIMREPLNGKIAEKWEVVEFDQKNEAHRAVAQMIWAEDWPEYVVPGYPWIRTWLMRQIDHDSFAMIAAVTVTQPDQARVSVHWLSPPSQDCDPESLYSWVAGTLAGSKLICHVVFSTHDLLQKTGELSYQIRERPERRKSAGKAKPYMLPQEPFLLPKYRPGGEQHTRQLRAAGKGAWPAPPAPPRLTQIPGPRGGRPGDDEEVVPSG